MNDTRREYAEDGTFQDIVFTDAEQTVRNAEIAAALQRQAAAQAQAALPDLTTQVANLTRVLITKGVLLPDDLPAAQITAINQVLAPSISQAQLE